MVRFSLVFLIVQTLWAIEFSTTTAQHSSGHANDNSYDRNQYSLQPAIEALRRRATKLALRDYENAHHENDDPKYISNSLVGNDYSNEPEAKKQHQINHILAKFLEKEREEEEEQENEQNDPYYDDDDDFYEERKRSIFRERGADENLTPYQSVFRERGLPVNAEPNHYNDPNNYALAQEFVREINTERENQYRENLARLLKKYEQEEEEAIERETLANEIRQNRLIEKRLTMPFLPLSRDLRRKRFPISKRSPLPFANGNKVSASATSSGTNEKVARDLQAIFGHPDRKLTSEIEEPQLQGHSNEQIHRIQKKSDHHTQRFHHHDNSKTGPHVHDYNSEGDSHEEDDDEDYKHEHDHDHQKLSHSHHDHVHDRDSDDSKEEDSEESESKEVKGGKTIQKSKRSIKNASGSGGLVNASVSASEQATPTTTASTTSTAASNGVKSSNKEYVGFERNDESAFSDAHNNKASSVLRIPSRRKKSIDWSKYFGLDRKKKSVDDWFMSKHKTEQLQNDNFPKSLQGNAHEQNAEKLENIDENLKSIEDHIIEDTIKYAGAHEASVNPEDIEALKNHVISRLATAYSLEKIRRTLARLRQERERNGHLDENIISDFDGPSRGKHASETSEKEKRVAVKKEKVEFDNNQHTIDSATEGNENKVAEPLKNNHFDDTASNSKNDDDERNKKRKRNGGRSFLQLSDNRAGAGDSIADDIEENGGHHYGHGQGHGRGHIELSYGHRFDHPFPGASNYFSGECPILDAIDKRCQKVDLITNSGAISEFSDTLLPACGIHQFCYLCGTSQTFCDFQYLSETDVICGSNKECQSTAHLVLMILRDSVSGPQQIGPKECAKNPCLLHAMKNAADY